jgi:PucR C-terminal helix-turn-helix domain/GGDEF-like domain
MTMRPQPSLHRVLDDLGATLLELVCAPSGALSGAGPGAWSGSGEIGGVAIHDPVDEPALPGRALVLGVGVHAPPDVAALLVSLGEHGAAGLVLRSPVTATPAVRAAVESSGVPLLALTRGASWTQLAALLRSLLAEGDVGDDGPETLGGIPSGDLFSVANAVAALIDAPVTIEDRSSRVLAFSGRQDEADRSRVETILGRQVPSRYTSLLVERGVFRELYRSDQPVYIEPPSGGGLPDFELPRAAVAVRAGDEVLGSIWAAVREPLTADRARAMGDAARLVALHLLRIRAGADVSRRLRADLVSTALEGGTGAFEAVRRLGLADQPVVVLALAVADPAERARLADGLAMHLSAIHPRCAAALVGDVAYGLVPVMASGAAGAANGLDGELRAVRIATDFLDRVGDRSRPVIGIGQVAFDAAGLPAARACADRALRVLRAGTGDPAGGSTAGGGLAGEGRGRRVARLADVHAEALLMELRDLAAAHGDRPTGPVARLSGYDAGHGTNLVETLRAWLDAFGDVAAASAAMFVHPNTFRYRLRRLTEVSGIDLADPEQRFAAMLQLRAVYPAEGRRLLPGPGMAGYRPRPLRPAFGMAPFSQLARRRGDPHLEVGRRPRAERVAANLRALRPGCRARRGVPDQGVPAWRRPGCGAREQSAEIMGLRHASSQVARVPGARGPGE